jgi:hypothetical protein
MRLKLLAFLCIVAAATALAGWLFPSEERQIRSRLEELAKTASIPPDEQELGRIARLGRLGRLLTDDVSLEGGAPLDRVSGRDAVLGLAAQVQRYTGGLHVVLQDVTVTVDDNRHSARAGARAVATERVAEGRETAEMRDVSLELAKTDQGWQLSRVVVAPERDPVAK